MRIEFAPRALGRLSHSSAYNQIIMRPTAFEWKWGLRIGLGLSIIGIAPVRSPAWDSAVEKTNACQSLIEHTVDRCTFRAAD